MFTHITSRRMWWSHARDSDVRKHARTNVDDLKARQQGHPPKQCYVSPEVKKVEFQHVVIRRGHRTRRLVIGM